MIGGLNLLLQKAFIAGEWIDSSKRIDVLNPANNSVIGSVPDCKLTDLQSAIKAASDSFNSWSETPAKERSNFLKSWQKMIVENQAELARIITLEQGKPLSESTAEILACANYIEWFAEEAKRAYGDIIPSNRKDTRIQVLKQPIGVVATITPWNFPALMITRKVAAALAAGCTVVSKPAELTPFSSLALAKLAEQAGLPKGVWNVLNGDPQLLGAELCSNKTIKKLSFTGSTRTGRLLLKQSADSIKKVSMELGGNAPFIVFESADIDLAVKGAIFGKFRNAGQTCICVNRFYIHENIYTEFRDKLIEHVKSFKIGTGETAGVNIGPLINQAAVDKVAAQVKDAAEKGANICLGGNKSDLGVNFFEPCILDGATSDMLVAREETFGPVAALFSFKDEQQVVKMANNTEHGLAAYFYSRDYRQIQRVAEKLESGMIGINETTITTENAPFGGVKESGFGREGSRYGLDEYLQIKYICTGGFNNDY